MSSAQTPAVNAGGQAESKTGLTGWALVVNRVGAYVALTKPRIIELLLVTTLPTMILAQRGFPSIWLVVATLVGGTLAAGSANALNCYFDRDIDVVMHRTKRRPLVTGEVTPRAAMVFGLTLGAISVTWLGFFVNWVSALLGFIAIFFYVVVYTLILKRRTAQNIVWGGAAGCMPVLIGWAAVTGSLTWAPLVLFGVIFFWTPPHYWPLAMRFRKDYAAAGVPMLPVVANDARVARDIVFHSVAMVACSLILIPIGPTGWFYGVSAGALGAWFLGGAIMLWRRTVREERRLGEMKLFHWSITYLTLLFVALALDPFLF
ncbi:MAG TPA: heme o synthase [Actinomycetales bacterium]|nr:heme o synthase [Actinomycetales bacterium]